jgi:hypothetical protein
VDEEALGLQKETVTIVDDRGPDDPPGLQLSNFRLVEEARTGNIVITLNRTDYDEPETETEGIHTYVIQVK